MQIPKKRDPQPGWKELPAVARGDEQYKSFALMADPPMIFLCLWVYFCVVWLFVSCLLAYHRRPGGMQPQGLPSGGLMTPEMAMLDQRSQQTSTMPSEQDEVPMTFPVSSILFSWRSHEVPVWDFPRLLPLGLLSLSREVKYEVGQPLFSNSQESRNGGNYRSDEATCGCGWYCIFRPYVYKIIPSV